jgi:hypothetical protein
MWLNTSHRSESQPLALSNSRKGDENQRNAAADATREEVMAQANKFRKERRSCQEYGALGQAILDYLCDFSDIPSRICPVTATRRMDPSNYTAFSEDERVIPLS